MESCEGMGAEETRGYVAELVTQQLNVPGFELLPDQVRCPCCATRCALRQLARGSAVAVNFLVRNTPQPCQPSPARLPCLPGCPPARLPCLQIFLVSARDALRARMALRAGASEADLLAFRQVAFGRLWEKVKDQEVIR